VSKVFGYPKFDENGEMVLTTYDNEYKAMMMDIRVYSMKAGQTRTFKREGEETAVLLRKTYIHMGRRERDCQQKRCIYRRTMGIACKHRKRNHSESRDRH